MSVRLHVIMEIPGNEPREFDYEFEHARITMGRDQNNDIQIPLSTVSRNHCIIFNESGEWYVEDLRSTHGTVHNGKQVGAGGKKLLRNGDIIELVHFKITFQHGGNELLSEDYSAEKTEALAQKMVQEVLASIGKDTEVPYLRVMNGPDEGVTFKLMPDMSEVVVGRGNDCDFQINDANISRRHAVIRRDWSDITIEDLGSKNGVVVNDKKIKGTHSLRDAAEILLGAVQLTFIDPSAKFIGKLDDIPAFAEATRGEESVVEDEPEPEPEPPPPEPEPEPPVAAAAPDANTAGVDALPPEGEDDPELPPIGEDDEGEEGTGQTNTGTRMSMKKGLGAVEYALIGLGVLVLLGIGGVVTFLLVGGE
jgi:pSer/pThr/pTyr-binding forkhead associated (FHA) protein